MMTLVIGNRNYSSWSLRAWLVLRHSGLEFETVRLALDTSEFRENIATFSDAGKVPVLVDGDLTVWDSMAIAEYMAERVPGLWPVKSSDRALARAVSAEMHSGFATIRQILPMNCRAIGRNVPLSNELAREITRIDRIWSECLSRQSGAGCLFGEWSIADAMFAPVVFRFNSYNIQLSELSHRYVQQQMEDKYMQEWLKASKEEAETIENEEVGLSL
ncbi:glutathione S-transferase family protein [Hahella ganghwensis]|uniref:glutathione S-transferase family protein n=1 Tax=Hahella ganghwensis TaxID=286420 RepID=UPI0003768550|nr:glutathione S-transferase family protein [Hahella ganghwensis]